MTRLLLLSLRSLLAAGLLLAAGCDASACEGDCECAGADCVCPATGDCLIDCTADCDLQCAGSGSCDFVCGPGCLAECTGSGSCVVDVGEASRVDCTGSGDCDVACHGDCTVSCPGSGDCVVRCDPGVDCTVERCEGPFTECPDGVVVCGGACP
jgi:hypothetical protein